MGSDEQAEVVTSRGETPCTKRDKSLSFFNFLMSHRNASAHLPVGAQHFSQLS